jgi:hypothetical protein
MGITGAETLLPPLPIDDGRPKLFQGSSAQLSQLRSYAASHSSNSLDNGDNDGDNEHKYQYAYNADDAETMLCHIPHASIQRRSMVSQSSSNGRAIGQLFISTRRLFFVAKTDDAKDNDLAMDAHCISLHAMTSGTDENDNNGDKQTESSVYCQLSSDSLVQGTRQEDEHEMECEGPMEVILSPIPRDRDDNDTNNVPGESVNVETNEELCQLLFDALSRLATLNPMEDDEEGDGTGGGGGGLMAMLAMMAGTEDESPTETDDMICRIDPNQLGTTAWGEEEHGIGQQDDEGPMSSNIRRQQELERLDNLLVVPPELEIQQGQFDDAESEDDKLL